MLVHRSGRDAARSVREMGRPWRPMISTISSFMAHLMTIEFTNPKRWFHTRAWESSSSAIASCFIVSSYWLELEAIDKCKATIKLEMLSYETLGDIYRRKECVCALKGRENISDVFCGCKSVVGNGRVSSIMLVFLHCSLAHFGDR